MKALLTLLGLILLGGMFVLFKDAQTTGEVINSAPLGDGLNRESDLPNEELTTETPTGDLTTGVTSNTPSLREVTTGDRQVFLAERISLPLPGSAPTENVKHTIPVTEIRQGCFRQDCIPSIDNPQFVNTDEAINILSPESIGIALSYQGVDRFYPFPMLETHELVNDTVAGVPILVSYCPLCGTGIVFDRRLDGEAIEFGVSGMLWQSNLLMYNRSNSIEERNLWSQVLGEAVVGARAGEKLTIIPSDIMRFTNWAQLYPNGQVLDGVPRDPYDGRYYEVAANFKPNFDQNTSQLAPDTYVYGIVVNGIAKAYPRDELPVGVSTDEVDSVKLTIQNGNGVVSFLTEAGQVIPDVEGFWFSWKAAHPDTLLYQ